MNLIGTRSTAHAVIPEHPERDTLSPPLHLPCLHCRYAGWRTKRTAIPGSSEANRQTQHYNLMMHYLQRLLRCKEFQYSLPSVHYGWATIRFGFSVFDHAWIFHVSFFSLGTLCVDRTCTTLACLLTLNLDLCFGYHCLDLWMDCIITTVNVTCTCHLPHPSDLTMLYPQGWQQ